MHHKFFIIDKKIFGTGSLNWTIPGATKNRENVIFIQNEGEVRTY